MQVGHDARRREADGLEIETVEQGDDGAERHDADLERPNRLLVDQFGNIERRPGRHVALSPKLVGATIALSAFRAKRRLGRGAGVHRQHRAR